MASAPKQSMTVRDVEVRTWPERSDVLVIDIQRAIVITHFPLVEPGPGKVADPTCDYTERARRAIRQMELDQEFLQEYFDIEEEHIIKLTVNDDSRQRIDDLLSEYGLSLDKVAMANVRKTLTKLFEMDSDQLFKLLCDWYDVVERHYPAGSVAREQDSWVHRATPEASCHFHYLAAGLTDRAAADEDDTEDAYVVFQELVDVPLRNFTFGHALRWVYFHKTEFADRTPWELQALLEAGA